MYLIFIHVIAYSSFPFDCSIVFHCMDTPQFFPCFLVDMVSGSYELRYNEYLKRSLYEEMYFYFFKEIAIDRIIEYMINIGLMTEETASQFSKVIIPIYIPTSNVCGLQLFHSIDIWHCRFLKFLFSAILVCVWNSVPL